MPGIKIRNEYADLMGLDLYTDAPKAVIAAVAVSTLTMGGSFQDEARERFCLEWERLFNNGIIPQPLPAAYRHAANKAREREDR